MDVNELLAKKPGKYIKAADITEPTTGDITKVTREVVGNDKTVKPCMYLDFDKIRPLILNVTNIKTLAAALGNETKDWTGASVTLDTRMVDFNGSEVASIYVVTATANAPIPY
jgi:hypothetical protein